MNTIRCITMGLLVAPAAVLAQAPAGWTDFTRTFQAYADSDRVVGQPR